MYQNDASMNKLKVFESNYLVSEYDIRTVQ